MAERRQTGRETRDGFEHFPVGEPLVVPEVKLLEGSTVGRGLHLTRDQSARAEQNALLVLPACALKELRERCDALPRGAERWIEAVIAQREAGLAAGFGGDATALVGAAAAVEKDEERNHEADNVGVHIADPTVAEQFGGNVMLFWWWQSKETVVSEERWAVNEFALGS